MDLKERIAAVSNRLNADQKKKLQEKAKAELTRLENLYSSKDTAKMIENYKSKYTICEIIYKIFLADYLRNNNKKSSKYLKVAMTQVPYTLSYAGYDFDYDFLSKIFGSSTKSGETTAKTLRDNLTHQMKTSSINELKSRYDELISLMDRFLNTIKSKKENE